MKILYGIQGTGNGHLTRARVMAKALTNKKVMVDYFISGRDRAQLFDMQPFGDFKVAKGLTFATNKGAVDYLQTAFNNDYLALYHDIKNMDLSQYDLVLNDFEPISAWAAKRQQVPCIGISHQSAFVHPVPKAKANFISDQLMQHFAPSDISLGCHWHHFDCQILPPFVDIEALQPQQKGQVLVYLPFEDGELINNTLALIPHIQFHVFHSQQPQQTLADNVHWHGFSRTKFKGYLASCEGIIANAGFELSSEALTLGKKLLLKPLHGQFEQASNVAALTLLGAADSMDELCIDNINRWLLQPAKEAISYPQVADQLVDWILAGDWQDTKSLCDSLWQQVQMPKSWQQAI
ncbi:MJ1255/VC2487 family glycosyltransferase [Paraferrimonas sp. SM1919]|uniref:MJ1255/VC2487 family glycosyltransferase n=1 Tax=Paraferrimonas sp. SM1919 TaxID=2662263 RepID=UPI0013D3AC68|nr:MJ1255/VC2487 family glycosyltransferase [Paraferrimonas sp. SM1919]